LHGKNCNLFSLFNAKLKINPDLYPVFKSLDKWDIEATLFRNDCKNNIKTPLFLVPAIFD
jgi:hypothetical protein